jgi:hypothetical protein
MSGFFELNASPGYINSLAQGFIADAKQLAGGVEAFRASVVDPNCFGDDTLGAMMKSNYPSSDDIDATCTTQKSLADNGELLAAGIFDMLRMVDDIVDQGEKNVENTKRTT